MKGTLKLRTGYW